MKARYYFVKQLQRLARIVLFFVVSLCGLLLTESSVWAQAPRTSYHIENFVYGHELNPAFQPEYSYFSMPVLGNTSATMQSTMHLDDFIYTRPDGQRVSFMAHDVISESDFMDKVGSGFKNFTDANISILSLGHRVDERRYQTLSLSLRATESLRVGRELFQLLKAMEERDYSFDDLKGTASAYLEIAAGESRHLNEHWTVGVKAKLLLGLMHMDFDVDYLDINFNSINWTAQGLVSMNTSGMNYITEMRDYYEEGKGQYPAVTGFEFGNVAPKALGLAVDAGFVYQPNERWTFSGAVRDFGVMSWFRNHEAHNFGDPFEFKGFSDIAKAAIVRDSLTHQPIRHSLSRQFNRLKDDLIDLAHLEASSTRNLFQMLGATLHAGVRYKSGKWATGALMTVYAQGRLSWWETRLNVLYTPIPRLDITIAPAYAMTGPSLGTLISYQFKQGFYLHVGSDAILMTFNKDFIPTSLCNSLQIGMAFGLK